MGRERRKTRFRADCAAQILVRELPPTAATAIDLSLGGAFFETEAALPLGLRVKIRLMPKEGPSIMVAGHILRVGYAEKTIKHPELDYLVVRANGLAIKFEQLDPEAMRNLEQYFDDLDPL